MSKRFLVFLLSLLTVTARADVTVNGQLKNAQLELKTSDPTCGATVEARVYWDSDDNLFRLCDGSSWLSIADLTTAQTFTNKTLTSPKINENVALTTTATKLNYLTSATGTTGTTSTNVVFSTTPTILTPLIDDYLTFNEESAPGTPSANTVRVYAKSDGLVYSKDDGGTETVLGGGGGSGSGELNLVANPVFANATTGWTNGTNHTGTRFTSGSSPLDGFISTGVEISSSAGTVEGNTNGFYYETGGMSPGLKSKKLKAEFYVTVPSADTWTVSVRQNGTRLALSTDSSGATNLPAGFSGKFTTYFETDSSVNALRIFFTKTAHSGTNNLIVTSVVIGPGTQPQGAVVGEWASDTATITASGGGSVSIGTGGNAVAARKYRRVGDSMEVQINWVFGTSGTSFGSSGNYRFATPSSCTPDSSKIGSNAGGYATIGNGVYYDSSASDFFGLHIVYNSASSVIEAQLEENVSGGVIGTATPVTLANSDTIAMRFTVPCTEFAGSGTLNVAQNDVEYAYNSSTTTSADTTSFAYGPVGIAPASFAPAGTASISKRVRFMTPIQITDEVDLEVTVDGTRFFNADLYWTFQQNDAGTTYYGADVVRVVGSDTDVDVRFYSNAIKGGAWSGYSSYKWRLKKHASGSAVGFGNVSQNNSGLVKSAGQLLGTNTNDSAATGYVGEVISATASSTSWGTTNVATDLTNASITLTAGNWDLDGLVVFNCTSTGTNTYAGAQISCTGTGVSSGLGLEGFGRVGVQNNFCSIAQIPVVTSHRLLTVSSGNTATCKLQMVLDYGSASSGTATTNSFIRGRRIR